MTHSGARRAGLAAPLPWGVALDLCSASPGFSIWLSSTSRDIRTRALRPGCGAGV